MATPIRALLTSLVLAISLLFVLSSTLRATHPRQDHLAVQYVEDNKDVGIKTAFSFGTPPEARSGSPQPNERATNPAAYNAATQKGTAFICQFKNRGQPSKYKDYSDLTKFGWNEEPSDAANNIPKPEMKGLLDDLSLSSDGSQNTGGKSPFFLRTLTDIPWRNCAHPQETYRVLIGKR